VLKSLQRIFLIELRPALIRGIELRADWKTRPNRAAHSSMIQAATASALVRTAIVIIRAMKQARKENWLSRKPWQRGSGHHKAEAFKPVRGAVRTQLQTQDFLSRFRSAQLSPGNIKTLGSLARVLNRPDGPGAPHAGLKPELGAGCALPGAQSFSEFWQHRGWIEDQICGFRQMLPGGLPCTSPIDRGTQRAPRTQRFVEADLASVWISPPSPSESDMADLASVSIPSRRQFGGCGKASCRHGNSKHFLFQKSGLIVRHTASGSYMSSWDPIAPEHESRL